MADFVVEFGLVFRSETGQFLAKAELAGQETVREAAEEGARLARENAPIGHKHDKRSVTIQAGITYHMIAATQARIVSLARHSQAVEFGSRPHEITGNPDLSFYWEERGKQFVPARIFYNDPTAITRVNHPGNDSQPFMRPSYDIVKHDIVSIARKHYP